MTLICHAISNHFSKRKKIHRRLFACDDTGNLIWCIFSSEISFGRNFKMCSRSLAERLEMIKFFLPYLTMILLTLAHMIEVAVRSEAQSEMNARE